MFQIIQQKINDHIVQESFINQESVTDQESSVTYQESVTDPVYAIEPCKEDTCDQKYSREFLIKLQLAPSSLRRPVRLMDETIAKVYSFRKPSTMICLI